MQYTCMRVGGKSLASFVSVLSAEISECLYRHFSFMLFFDQLLQFIQSCLIIYTSVWKGWSWLDIGLKSEVLDKIVMNLWIMQNSIEFMRVVKQKLKAYRTRVVKPYEWNGMLPYRVWWPCTYICLEAAFDLHGLTNAVTRSVIRWLTGIHVIPPAGQSIKI